jgi:hypothetical protein
VRFFLERYEHVGDVQFSLELGVALLELCEVALSLTELWFAPRLLRCETRCTLGTELGAPGRQQ